MNIDFGPVWFWVLVFLFALLGLAVTLFAAVNAVVWLVTHVHFS